jgi:hypothetical protein
MNWNPEAFRLFVEPKPETLEDAAEQYAKSQDIMSTTHLSRSKAFKDGDKWQADECLLLNMGDIIEKWQEKHSAILAEYSKGNANNEVMKMYRSQMHNILDFINDLNQLKLIKK